MATRLYHATAPDGKVFDETTATRMAVDGWQDTPLPPPDPVLPTSGELATEPPAEEPPVKKAGLDVREIPASELRPMIARLEDRAVLQRIQAREGSTEGGGRKGVLTLIAKRLKELDATAAP